LSRGRKGERAERGAPPTAAEQLAAVESQDRDVKRANRKPKSVGAPTARRSPAAKAAPRGAKPASKHSKR
jgi:hypothetical protein